MVTWIGLALLAIAALVGFHLYARLVVERSEREYPPLGRFITVEGVRLHVLEAGNGHPVVLFHGSAGSIEGYAATLLDVVAPKYRLILLDRPGYGHSQPMQETATIEAQCRLIHALLKQMNVRQPTILGHSWSTSLAIGYALQYPQEVGALVLMGPSAYLRPIPSLRFAYRLVKVPVLGRLFLDLLVIAGPDGVEKRLMTVFAPESMPEGFRRAARSIWMRPNSARAFITEWAPQTFGPSAEAIQSRYGVVDVAVVLLAGELDHIAPIQEHARRLQHLIPGSELMIVPGAGHQIYVMHPTAVLEAIGKGRQLQAGRSSL